MDVAVLMNEKGNQMQIRDFQWRFCIFVVLHFSINFTPLFNVRKL
jgi:hypothetical protein